MEQFNKLEAQVTEAAQMVSKLVWCARRSGFPSDQLPALEAELQPFVARLETCLGGPVTEAFLEATLQQYTRVLPVLMAAVNPQGPTN